MENKRFSEMTLQELVVPGGHPCSCGKVHKCELQYLEIAPGAIRKLPEMMEALHSRKPFILFDENTYEAAGKEVLAILEREGIPSVNWMIPGGHVKPGEWACGSALLHFDPSCDLILAVGSGVLNDICKVLSHATGVPNAVVGTAPSMDGYASNSSAMEVNNLKVTLYNHAPRAILLDTEIMAKAPMRMLQAGFGDIIAKYIALCEWRIARIVTGEYYCEEIAEIMRTALRRVWNAADGIPRRDPEAIGAIAEGLVLAGIAMSYAETSRPASGMEHYFSHIWEMMALERGKPYDLHGIQVGVGTILSMKLYRRIRALQPSYEKAEAHMAAFSQKAWEAEMRRIFGKTGEEVLKVEEESKKNDPRRQAEHLAKILAHWDEICRVMDEELPDYEALRGKMEQIGEPVLPSELNISLEDTLDAFTASRDIRNKYVGSSMLWDLGELEDLRAYLRGVAEE